MPASLRITMRVNMFAPLGRDGKRLQLSRLKVREHQKTIVAEAQAYSAVPELAARQMRSLRGGTETIFNHSHLQGII